MSNRHPILYSVRKKRIRVGFFHFYVFFTFWKFSKILKILSIFEKYFFLKVLFRGYKPLFKKKIKKLIFRRFFGNFLSEKSEKKCTAPEVKNFWQKNPKNQPKNFSLKFVFFFGKVVWSNLTMFLQKNIFQKPKKCQNFGKWKKT